MKIILPILTLCLLTATLAPAQDAIPLGLNSLFSERAVLQRDQPLPIFGTAPAGSKVKVSFADKTQETTATNEGAWRVEFPGWPAGGPHTLTVESGGQKISSADILMGDVWLMAGQSNMAAEMKYYGLPEDMAASDFPKLRMYQVPETSGMNPAADAKSTWRIATAGQVGGWSAMAYLTARDLLRNTGVPQGVVVCARGNTPIASWLHMDDIMADAELKPKAVDFLAKLDAYSPDARKNYPDLQKQSEAETVKAKQVAAQAKALSAEGKPTPTPVVPTLPPDLFGKKALSGNYNGMLATLRGFSFRGVVWYQGESDAGRGPAYSDRLAAFFKRIRENQQEPALPIFIVQLPKYQMTTDGTTVIAPLRDEQRQFVLATEGAQLISMVDLGEANQIHPKPKNPFAERVTKAIEAAVYKGATPSVGPYPTEAKAVDGGVVISFRETGDKLLPDGQPIGGFETSEDGRIFVPARALAVGREVHVETTTPAQYVRYLWQDVPSMTDLKNSDGMPAGSFLLQVGN